jgi:hypothetical protein
MMPLLQARTNLTPARRYNDMKNGGLYLNPIFTADNTVVGMYYSTNGIK